MEPPPSALAHVAEGREEVLARNIPLVVGPRSPTRGYWRIHDHSLLPSLKDTRLLLLDGEYLELAPLEKPLLTRLARLRAPRADPRRLT